jgi:hypothetical protein
MSVAVKPYYLLGSRTLARIEAQVHAALDKLAVQWWPQEDAVQNPAVYALDASQLTALGSRARYLLQQQEQWLAVFGTERSALQLAQGWLGCSIDRADDLVKTLEQRFYAELFCALTDAATLPALATQVECKDLPESTVRPGSSLLAIDVVLGGVEQKWVTTAALWPFTQAAPRAAPRHKLVAAATALGQSRVRLEASLPAVQMPLAEVAGLMAGDFLNLQHDLSGRLQLSGTDIQLSLPAVLGRRGAHKAALIAALVEEKK